MRSVRRALIVVLVLPVVAGCSSGPPSGEVRGKVTFKGEPVKEGTVTFLNPTQGGAYEAKLNAEGVFEVSGKVAVGEYLVIVTPLIEIKDTDPGKSPPAPVEKPAPNIPIRFRQQGSTPLRANVKAGKNDFTFDMIP